VVLNDGNDGTGRGTHSTCLVAMDELIREGSVWPFGRGLKLPENPSLRVANVGLQTS